MARVQVGYDPRAEALQTTAAPNIQTVQARQADPNSSRAFQLAAALGAPSVQQGLDALGQKVQANKDKKDDQEGTALANSMTVEDLGSLVRDKKILHLASPAFVAAVNHTYGSNALNELANTTISKLNRGELSFADDPEGATNRKTGQQKLEEYLVKERNRILEGQDNYAVAGFDKGWLRVRESILDANNKVLDKNFVESAVQQASESFRSLNDTAKRTGMSNEDMVKEAISRYGLLKDTRVLINPEVQKAALKGFAMTLAADGNQDALNRLLYSNLPNNGPSVRSFLGDQDSLILEKNAEGMADKRLREEADNWMAGPRRQASAGELNEEQFRKDAAKYEKIVGSATVQSIVDHNNSVIAGKARELDKLNTEIVKARENDFAVQQAQAAIAAGRPVQDMVLPSGRTIKAQDAGAAAMERFVRDNPNMAPQELIRRYAQGGIKNPQWERTVGVALNNIGEVNIDASGKPVGQLLPATMEALDTFAVVRQVSEAYAREVAGSERNYETLTHIQALRENGIGDANLAAALVNQKNRRNIAPSTWGAIQSSVNTEIEQVSNPSITTGRFWGEVFRGELGKGEKNLIVMKDAVRKLAETYLSAGVAGDAKQAVTKAAEYFADPRVTTQINNTIYLNKDLPDLPQGMDRTKWFEKSMAGVVGEKLKAAGVKYNSNDLVLIPQDGGNAPYMVSLRGIPTGIFVTKQEIKSWIMAESDREDAALVEAQKKAKATTVRPSGRGATLSPEEFARRRAAGQ